MFRGGWLVGVIRAWAIARAYHHNQILADDEATPMAIIGGLVLWLLRLALAPPSTITGFRGWAVEEGPNAPGRKALCPAPATPGHAPQRQPGVVSAGHGGQAETFLNSRSVQLARGD
ncbi:MAG TPA: hypothetical protein VLW50_00540 [Streptosporangiaceae bacterium]|nr:hypothetical protein [Streptosporangiaceae bacterium]